MSASDQLRIDVEYVIPSDQQHLHDGAWLRNAPVLRDPALLPQQGDVVLMAPRSAWVVVLRHFVWNSPKHMRVRVFLDHQTEQLAVHAPARPQLVVAGGERSPTGEGAAE